MAMEKLATSWCTPMRFDVVVVDTPTRNALDLLDAPRRLTRFCGEPPLPSVARADPDVAGGPSAWPRRPCCAPSAKVAGAEIVQDTVAFFQAFEGMEDGFPQPGFPPSTSCSPGIRPRLLRPGPTSARPDCDLPRRASSPRSWASRDVTVAALVVNRIAALGSWAAIWRIRRSLASRGRSGSPGGGVQLLAEL